MSKVINIVVSTIFQDAGDATRGIEIAKGIVKYSPPEYTPNITFISRGSRFENLVLEQGFNLYHALPQSDGVGERHDYKMTPSNFIGDKILAQQLIEGEINAYKELQPDLVLYGFWPPAGLAYRMMDRNIIGVCYLPLPLTTEKFIEICTDIPEHVPIISSLPKSIRKNVLKYIPNTILKNVPPLKQSNIVWAAKQLGCKNVNNIFDLLKADLTLVNDIPENYCHVNFGETIKFTGPLYAAPYSKEIDSEILNIISSNNKRLKIFCTLGSSGTEQLLKEIAKVFTSGPGLDWDAVILSPESICPAEKIKAICNNRPGVLVTDTFVPALEINKLCDIVVCHGGQGTIQTALTCGTPIVGVAAQSEQFINLSNVEKMGCGIRLNHKKWKHQNITNSILKIINNSNYKSSIVDIQKKISAIDGQKKSAYLIWQHIKSADTF